MSTALPLEAEPATAPQASRYVLPFGEVGLGAIGEVGGKNASLGELIAALGPAGVRVPDGFAITAAAFRLHLAEAGLDRSIYAELDRLDLRDVAALATVARGIRERVAAAPLPAAVAVQLEAAYRALSARYGEPLTDVAVRSSATAEDLPSASFAGQQESYLNVRGSEALDRAVRSCFASLFTDRAIVYRVQNGFRHRDVALSVGDPEDGAERPRVGRRHLHARHRERLPRRRADHRRLGPRRDRGARAASARTSSGSTSRRCVTGTARSCGARSRRRRSSWCTPKAAGTRSARCGCRRRIARGAVLSDDEVLTLARWALAIEDHYSGQAGRPTPMDIEWARDGRTGELFIVQARPETVHSQRAHPTLELWRRRGEGKPLVTGRSVGSGVASGPVRVILRSGASSAASRTARCWSPR